MVPSTEICFQIYPGKGRVSNERRKRRIAELKTSLVPKSDKYEERYDQRTSGEGPIEVNLVQGVGDKNPMEALLHYPI